MRYETVVRTLAEVRGVIRRAPADLVILAGGTDLMVRARAGRAQPRPRRGPVSAGAAVRKGDASCHAGFYHGAMEALLLEKGTASLAADIERLCRVLATRSAAPGPSTASGTA